MYVRPIVYGALLVAGTWFAAGLAHSQESGKETAQESAIPAPPPAEQPTPAEMQEAMARWLESCQTTQHHKGLARLLGKWKSEMTIWGMSPEPMTTVGEIEYTWLVEGRWVQGNGTQPMPGLGWFTFFGISGYDNYRQKYVDVRIDSMTTAMYTSEGNYDKSRKNLIMYGVLDEPMTGEVEKPVKYITRFLSDDERVIEVHDLAIGEEDTKVLEFRLTRIKKGGGTDSPK